MHERKLQIVPKQTLLDATMTKRHDAHHPEPALTPLLFGVMLVGVGARVLVSCDGRQALHVGMRDEVG